MRVQAISKSISGWLIAGLLQFPVTAQQIAAQIAVQQSPQKNAPRGSSLYRFRATSELVLVNVVVRDKKGEPVRGLSKEDFAVLEDNKPQTVLSFDFENVEVAPAVRQQVNVLSAERAPAAGSAANQAPVVAPGDLRDRRLIILFFDLTSLQPEEIERAVEAAKKFVAVQMTPADLVSVVSLSSSLQVNQDFTSDRTKLAQVVESFSPSSGQGFDQGATGDTEGTPDTAQQFTPDESEYNIFNTDRKLQALQAVAETLARVEQKKSIIYFSSGVSKTGIENQSALRAAINAAVRGNVSLYAMDMRGLQALVPGGEAQQASLRGAAPYSGEAVRGQFNSNFGSQETLVTLAADTGGKAFLDSNDFGAVFTKVQQDTSAYYLLGYRSTNPARDGRFRRISVRMNRPGLKLEARRGYYAPKDFAHFTREDREQQLEEELSSELSSTDLPVYMSAAYFRLDGSRYFIPVSLVVPGNEIPFTRASDKDKASLDVLGVVRDEAQRPAGNVRDTVKLAVEEAQQVRRKNVQYTTGFTLIPGKYHLKFVVRENQSGKTGSFETDFVVPELKKAPLKVSSVVVGTQINRDAKKKAANPLVREGGELVPNVSHVFSSDQHLYFYYEIYDPAKGTRMEPAAKGKSKGRIHLLTNIQFFNGRVKTYETPLVETTEVNSPERHAAVFQFDVPLSQLRPGLYTCQVNVIDDAAGSFVFPRLALLVRK